MKKQYLVPASLIVIIAAIAIGAYYISKIHPVATTPTPSVAPTSTPKAQISASVSSSPSISAFADPVANFKSRVTKKPFGIYITPQNSPVQPERFTGYHTGADAEYQDITNDVPVYAIADCQIVLSETASGYGGVFMISFDLNGSKHSALYGHIRPSSLPKVGTSFKKGDRLGLLGTGYSAETDGERRHLHFAILADNSLSIKGYVGSKSQLSGWIDPLSLYP